MSEAREAILAAVRRQLAGARAPELPPVAHEGWQAPEELGAHFRARLVAVGAELHDARDEAEAGAALRAIVARHGARSLLCSDAEQAVRIAELGAADSVRIGPDAPREELLAADIGLCFAQWGIAETGTLVLESARERHRFVSLLPPVHVALLSLDRLLPSLGDALARVASGGPDSISRAITFITGPSRTADIELRLVVGVHGPKVLHVILLEHRAVGTLPPADDEHER